MFDLLLGLSLCAVLAVALLFLISPWGQKPSHFRRVVVVEASAIRSHKKPEWVIAEVLRLKALLGKHVGCRKVADTFNRLHAPTFVGKTFVSEVIKANQYALLSLIRDFRNNQPEPVAVNAVWGIDMTFVTDDGGIPHACVGMIDHGSRVCTRLAVLLNKRSWTLLGHLCLAIGSYGKPNALRTDNEACMNSFVFRAVLKLIGVNKQTVPVAAPWCNGKIERMFGSAKPLLKALLIPDGQALQSALNSWRDFYNHVRTHQHLDGLTPSEAWQGLSVKDIRQMPVTTATLVRALSGVMVGYHIRR